MQQTSNLSSSQSLAPGLREPNGIALTGTSAQESDTDLATSLKMAGDLLTMKWVGFASTKSTDLLFLGFLITTKRGVCVCHASILVAKSRSLTSLKKIPRT